MKHSVSIVHCVSCDSELANLTPGKGFQPSRGTAFTSRGHYGSTVFDPMDGTFLEIVVCDPCLERAVKRRRVLLGEDAPRPSTKYSVWEKRFVRPT